MRQSNGLRAAIASAAAFSLFSSVSAIGTYVLDNVTNPTSFFYSRPDLSAPAMNVSLYNASSVTSGYLFIAPYQNTQASAYIYDKLGNLVWSGFGQAGAGPIQNFYVCTYQSADHLCYFEGNDLAGYAAGHGTILDSNYTHVASVKTGSDAPPVDQHEFNVINNGVSALVTAYGPTPYDLSSLNITGGIGWVLNGMFQEIEIATGNVLFQWPALDHVPISESVITPGSTDVSGTGIYPQSAFDYFHINAIDKLPSGDYLVSSRHTSTVFCVSAIDGSISWRLSSQKQSDFNVTGFKFGFQHDVRFVSENSTHTIISIYDNSNNGFATVNAKSSGMVIALDMNAKVATLQQQYTWPFPGGLSSASQGNLQMIGNDSTANKFMSGGSWPAFAEFSDDGTAVFAASLNNGLQGDVMSYRGYTFNWSSTPANTVPAVYAYSMNSNSSTSIYVSWNGATEVSSWRFYGAMTSYDLAVIGTANKTGFETMFTTNAHYVYAVVEALDASGNALRNSSVTTAFTPSAKLVSACNSQQCAIVANAAVTSVVSAVGTPTSTAISTATATGTSTATGAAATSKAAAAGDIGPSMSTFGTIGILALLQYVWT